MEFLFRYNRNKSFNIRVLLVPCNHHSALNHGSYRVSSRKNDSIKKMKCAVSERVSCYAYMFDCCRTASLLEKCFFQSSHESTLEATSSYVTSQHVCKSRQYRPHRYTAGQSPGHVMALLK